MSNIEQEEDAVVDASELINDSGEVAREGRDAQGDEAVASIVAPIDELKTVLAAELSTDTTQYYLNQIGTRPLFDSAEELHYATLAKQGDFDARQKMIEHNLRLVVSIA
ncbi:MAG: RNA polymerase sigma factor RpoS, partial [Burkholderiales bacterium]|nr:RNA polymerase sigma factor RpoS [Burkholderiales bacterium]